MADIIAVLNRKRANLVTEKMDIQREADAKLARVDGEIKRIDEALETLNAACQRYLCLHCKGSGSVRHADAAGDMEDWPCEKCGGTGVAVDAEVSKDGCS